MATAFPRIMALYPYAATSFDEGNFRPFTNAVCKHFRR